MMDALAKNYPNLFNQLSSLFPMIAIGVIFYFFLIKPQQKKAKAHGEMIHALKKGDKVITQGGIVATISKILNDQEVSLELSDNVHVTILKDTIRGTYDALQGKDSVKK
jgi:preprotein translocase subunit YajC